MKILVRKEAFRSDNLPLSRAFCPIAVRKGHDNELSPRTKAKEAAGISLNWPETKSKNHCVALAMKLGLSHSHPPPSLKVNAKAARSSLFSPAALKARPCRRRSLEHWPLSMTQAASDINKINEASALIHDSFLRCGRRGKRALCPIVFAAISCCSRSFFQ